MSFFSSHEDAFMAGVEYNDHDRSWQLIEQSDGKIIQAGATRVGDGDWDFSMVRSTQSSVSLLILLSTFLV